MERDIRVEEKRQKVSVQRRFVWVRCEGRAPQVVGGCKGMKVREGRLGGLPNLKAWT